MKRLACVIALAGAFISNHALAWGPEGHRAVGAIAEKLIKGTNAEKQVAALLLPGETLESITNWADCVKGTYCGPQSEEMQAYVGANAKHSEYHYTDVPFQLERYQDGAVGTHGNDIVQTLKQAIAVLQGKTDPALNPHRFTRRQALLLIAHLAGDIHQPLHVGAAYVGKDGQFVAPSSDGQIDAVTVFDARGGNNLLLDEETLVATSAKLIPAKDPADVKPPVPGAPKYSTRPFHSYWDGTAVDYAMRRISARTPEQFAKLVVDSKPVVAANTGDPALWPYQWADDALVASKLAYAGVKVGAATTQTSKKGEIFTTWRLDVPNDYPVPSSALAKTQLIKGGYHLAALLQAIWP